MIPSELKADVKRSAERLYAKKPDWVTFYREILGMNGLVRQACPTREMLNAFEQTEAFDEILQMLARLREKGPLAADEDEPTRVITVRLPKCLHEALRSEAFDHHTSMNKLCISKLLQYIDGEKVAVEI
jgi:predicted HicB family RNase H-like nuclease